MSIWKRDEGLAPLVFLGGGGSYRVCRYPREGWVTIQGAGVARVLRWGWSWFRVGRFLFATWVDLVVRWVRSLCTFYLFLERAVGSDRDRMINTNYGLVRAGREVPRAGDALRGSAGCTLVAIGLDPSLEESGSAGWGFWWMG